MLISLLSELAFLLFRAQLAMLLMVDKAILTSLESVHTICPSLNPLQVRVHGHVHALSLPVRHGGLIMGNATNADALALLHSCSLRPD